MPRLAIAAAALLVLVALGVASAKADQSPATALPFRTAVLSGTDDSAQVKALGASAIVLFVFWSSVAPQAPPDPRNPGSASYQWAAFDDAVKTATASGLDVIAVVTDAPAWALRPAKPGLAPTLPDASAFADFAAAAAARYSGSYGNLPAVRYWEAWNEPNIHLGLKPQFVDGQPVTPAWYREMLNRFYDEVKAVSPENVVIGGGLAPFFDNNAATMAVDADWGPLSFTRRVLCLSETLQQICSTPTRFDVWAIHPYTEGSPSHRAALPNDVSLPDIPKMRAVLEAAEQKQLIQSAHPVELWAPEFSWDSMPPAAGHVPQSVLLRWVPQALYGMWHSGVTLVAWLTYRDIPGYLPATGLALADGTQKAHARAFAFPLVGMSHRDQLEVWGRTPGGRQADVTIERSTGGGSWTTLGTLASDADGIFQGRFAKVAPVGSIRALAPALGEQSAQFPLGPDPNVNDLVPAAGNIILEPDPAYRRPAIPMPPAGGSNERIAAQQRLRAGVKP